jgi:hypothetical protein
MPETPLASHLGPGMGVTHAAVPALKDLVAAEKWLKSLRASGKQS